MPSVSSEEWFPTPSVIDCTETESNLEWRELLELRATGTHIDRARLKAALSHGIPPALRPQAWLSFSGCTEWMRRHPMVYDQLCTRVERGGSGAPDAGVQDQIEKDLRRTEAGTSGAKLEALRRVLQAFASFNPTIGYVQGMNFIAAGLLRVLPEAAAFWMLVLIEQEYLPAHFGESMTGNHVDCRVLSRLTAEHLPRLSAQLKARDAPLQPLQPYVPQAATPCAQAATPRIPGARRLAAAARGALVPLLLGLVRQRRRDPPPVGLALRLRPRLRHAGGHVHGVCMVCAWCVHGVCMVCAWRVHGIYTDLCPAGGARLPARGGAPHPEQQ